MRLRLLIVVATLPLALWMFLPLGTEGQTGRVSQLNSKIDKKRSAVNRTKQRERVLRAEVGRWSNRISELQTDITRLQSKQVRLQADLDRKRAELARVQEDLRQQRARLTRLRARLVESRTALASRLVELYKADEPDVLTVVLEADGFAELLERTEFMTRVSRQDARILDRVRTAKAESTAIAKRLTRLEKRQRAVAAVIQSRRDEVAAVRDRLTDRRDTYAAVRSRKTQVLTSVKGRRMHLQKDLAELERESARIASALQAADGGSSQVAGPPRTGAGGLTWPVNGPIVSPFGPRWGRLHAGVDIAAPAGTPIRAASAGKVVLLGVVGGYGNYVCISHGGGLSTCYAHLSSYATSNGASVGRGQVIGAVGCTGHCYGDHLHFETRINGNPVNPAGYL